MRVQPVPALVYSGILATLDKNEAVMRKCFRNALSYKKDLAYINFNYAVSLMKFGCSNEAHEIFMSMLDDELSVATYLDEIAFAALELNSNELSEKILLLADRLQINSKSIHFLAMHMSLAMADSSGDEAEILKCALSDEELKKNSVPLTNKEWERMQNFAAELKQYL